MNTGQSILSIGAMFLLIIDCSKSEQQHSNNRLSYAGL